MSKLLNSYTEVELAMNAVERILEYANTLPQERYEPTAKGDSALATPPPVPSGWPTSGEIVVTRLTMRYSNTMLSTPPALRDLSFAIPARTSCGVCGRTGAGKSSLFLALLRMVEPAPAIAGAPPVVVIDGVDVSKLPLRTLRSCLAIVPQDPTLVRTYRLGWRCR